MRRVQTEEHPTLPIGNLRIVLPQHLEPTFDRAWSLRIRTSDSPIPKCLIWRARRDCFGACGPSSSATLRTAAAPCAAASNPAQAPGCRTRLVGLPGVRITTPIRRCRRRVLGQGKQWCARRDCFGACGPSSSATLRTAAAPCAAASNPAQAPGCRTRLVGLPGVRITTPIRRCRRRVLGQGKQWCARRDSNSRPPGS